MKKYLNYAFAGAIALTGAVGFASCSSSGEDVVNNTPINNPTNIPEQEAVKTQFTISLPSNVARATTRQSAATVQNAQTIETFRGMDNIVLLPFAATGAVSTDPVASTFTKLSDKISLTKIIKPNAQDVNNSIPVGTAGLLAGSNSVLYNDVAIPVGTGSFLFYGKAIDTGSDKFVNGSLDMTEGQPSAIKFDPVQIYPTETTPSTVGAALAAYLSNIAQVANWEGCANTANSGETWYNSALGPLYTKFTGMKAGSSRTVQAAVQDLYSEIKDNTDGVSNAIKTAITTTYASDPGTGVLTFTAAIGNSEATYFPGDVNLPDGAALLSYDENSNTFTQKTDGNGNTGSVTAKYADYVYPASLYYYCNSGIKTSNSSQQGLYDGTNTWPQITGNDAFSGNSVGTSTRSVAILDPIQYGVGRLDATVKLEAATLYDKNGTAYDATNGFTVTGILIGGQKQVGYDFKPISTAQEYTIYDNVTKSNGTLSATTTASATNYTLALETGVGVDQVINVAVELVNNGAAFEGADGIVPAGCKFYLVAQLTPNPALTNVTGSLNQVFKQDHKTIVTFTIKTGLANPGNTVGLGAAHNLIPDFRSPKMELGLSVDLTWQSGLQFDINL